MIREGHHFTIQVFRHGWLLCGPGCKPGIPINALMECAPLTGRKHALVCSGIAHHYRTLGFPSATLAIAKDGKAADKWGKEIEAYIAERWSWSTEQRWWHGVHVGASSTSIFAALARKDWYGYLWSESPLGATPQDAADFSRCLNLLGMFPEWVCRLDEVAATYPKTAWPRIVDAWPQLVAASFEKRTQMLRELNTDRL